MIDESVKEELELMKQKLRKMRRRLRNDADLLFLKHLEDAEYALDAALEVAP